MPEVKKPIGAEALRAKLQAKAQARNSNYQANRQAPLEISEKRSIDETLVAQKHAKGASIAQTEREQYLAVLIVTDQVQEYAQDLPQLLDLAPGETVQEVVQRVKQQIDKYALIVNGKLKDDIKKISDPLPAWFHVEIQKANAGNAESLLSKEALAAKAIKSLRQIIVVDTEATRAKVSSQPLAQKQDALEAMEERAVSGDESVRKGLRQDIEEQYRNIENIVIQFFIESPAAINENDERLVEDVTGYVEAERQKPFAAKHQPISIIESLRQEIAGLKTSEQIEAFCNKHQVEPEKLQAVLDVIQLENGALTPIHIDKPEDDIVLPSTLNEANTVVVSEVLPKPVNTTVLTIQSNKEYLTEEDYIGAKIKPETEWEKQGCAHFDKAIEIVKNSKNTDAMATLNNDLVKNKVLFVKKIQEIVKAGKDPEKYVQDIKEHVIVPHVAHVLSKETGKKVSEQAVLDQMNNATWFQRNISGPLQRLSAMIFGGEKKADAQHVAKVTENFHNSHVAVDNVNTALVDVGMDKSKLAHESIDAYENEIRESEVLDSPLTQAEAEVIADVSEAAEEVQAEPKPHHSEHKAVDNVNAALMDAGMDKSKLAHESMDVYEDEIRESEVLDSPLTQAEAEVSEAAEVQAESIPEHSEHKVSALANALSHDLGSAQGSFRKEVKAINPEPVVTGPALQ